MIYRKTTGERIEDLIKLSGKTLTVVAKELNVSPSTLSEIINKDIKATEQATAAELSAMSAYQSRNRKIGSAILIKICNYFNVSADYILGLTEVKSLNQTTQSIHRVTGLSEQAIENLRSIKKTPEAGLYFVNSLLEDEQALFAFSSLINEIINEEKEAATNYDVYKRNLSRYIECVDILRNMTEKAASSTVK